MRRHLATTALLLPVLAWTPAAWAQAEPERPAAEAEEGEAEAEAEEEEEGWEAVATAHIYFPLRGEGEALVAGVGTRAEHLEPGLVALGGRIEIESPWRLSGLLDVYHTPTEYDLDGPTQTISRGASSFTVTPEEARIDRLNVDLLLGFRALELELGELVEVGLTLEAGVGWVHYRSRLDARLDGLAVTFDEREDAFELVIGADLEVSMLGDLVGVVLQGDLGGFGIGESSKLSWKLVAMLRLRPISLLSFDVGYRGLSVEYAAAGERLELEAVTHGIVLAANLHF